MGKGEGRGEVGEGRMKMIDSLALALFQQHKMGRVRYSHC